LIRRDPHSLPPSLPISSFHLSFLFLRRYVLNLNCFPMGERERVKVRVRGAGAREDFEARNHYERLKTSDLAGAVLRGR